MKFYISLFILFSVSFNSLNAQSISSKVRNILENIKNGYVIYGFEELKNLAQVNDISAQFYLAECYNLGIGTDKDIDQAFKLYRRTAERGLSDGMIRLAKIYREGIIVKIDENKAKDWENRYRKKGGRNNLPDFSYYLNEGLKTPQNYALNPNQTNNDKEINSQGNVAVNNITIIQSSPKNPIQNNNISPISFDQSKTPPSEIISKSNVDYLKESIQSNNINTFVLIIANENYHDAENVPNAIHDGEIFMEYCSRLLGIPERNIHYIKDATLNNIKREINLISQISEEFKGEANVIFYYAGHGIPDEKTKDSYIVPIDGYSTDLTTCYPTGELYSKLGKLPANKIIIFLDACFSGSLRGEGMLASTRGISIKSNPHDPKGKMVIFSAAQGDETAFSYDEEGHGMFTYFLLKHLKESKGEITLKELAEKIESDVRKQSLIINGKRQTPTVQYSNIIKDIWYDWKLNE